MDIYFLAGKATQSDHVTLREAKISHHDRDNKEPQRPPPDDPEITRRPSGNHQETSKNNTWRRLQESQIHCKFFHMCLLECPVAS